MIEQVWLNTLLFYIGVVVVVVYGPRLLYWLFNRRW